MIININNIKFPRVKDPQTNEEFYMAYNEALFENGTKNAYEEIMSSIVVATLINPEVRMFTAAMPMKEKEVDKIVKKIEQTGRKVIKVKGEGVDYALGIWTSIKH